MRLRIAVAALFLFACAKPAPAPTIPGSTLDVERLDNGCVRVERDAETGLRIPPQIVCGARNPNTDASK